MRDRISRTNWARQCSLANGNVLRALKSLCRGVGSVGYLGLINYSFNAQFISFVFATLQLQRETSWTDLLERHGIIKGWLALIYYALIG